MRGGANGARINLAPQKDWKVNKPQQLAKVLGIYNDISSQSNASLADVIVLGGNVGIEEASGLEVPFTPGRGDASEDQTDVESFDVLEPVSDGFRNYHSDSAGNSPEEMLLDKAQLLNLTATEMTLLVGGLRSLGINSGSYSSFTDSPGKLSSDFFKTLLDMSVKWESEGSNNYKAIDRSSGEEVRKASRVDLVFGSNSQLRAICEVYASNDAKEKFASDFISAWNKVMNNDLF